MVLPGVSEEEEKERKCLTSMTRDSEVTKMAELKPCPFCGGEAAFLGTTCTIKCKQCGGAFIATNPVVARMEIAAAWNRRVNDGQVHNQSAVETTLSVSALR